MNSTKKIFLLFLFLQLPLVADTIHAQDSVLHPYIGASFNIVGQWPDLGFGIESGLKYNYFYLGAEYGVSGIILFHPLTTIDPPDQVSPHDVLQNLEQYYGFQSGIIIHDQIWLGITFLWSTATVTHVMDDTTFSQFHHFWFNVGPDFRGHISDHVTLNFAYTIRRGLKIGGAYVF